jgi:hypothetical protein
VRRIGATTCELRRIDRCERARPSKIAQDEKADRSGGFQPVFLGTGCPRYD